MSNATQDIFAICVSYISKDWIYKTALLDLLYVPCTRGDVLKAPLEKVLNNYSIRNKIVCYVTDGGRNLQVLVNNMANDVNCKLLNNEKGPKLSCFAHILNNAMKFMQKEVDEKMGDIVKNTVRELKRPVTLTHKSSVFTADFEQACTELGFHKKRLPIDYPTRFTSRFDFLAVAVSYKSVISRVYSNRNENHLTPQPNSYDITEAIIAAFQIIHSTCINIQSNGVWFLSDATILILDILIKLHKIHCDANCVNIVTMKTRLIKVLTLCASDYIMKYFTICHQFNLSNAYMYASMMLDPRYKKLNKLKNYLNSIAYTGTSNIKQIHSKYIYDYIFPMIRNTEVVLNLGTNVTLDTDDDLMIQQSDGDMVVTEYNQYLSITEIEVNCNILE